MADLRNGKIISKAPISRGETSFKKIGIVLSIFAMPVVSFVFFTAREASPYKERIRIKMPVNEAMESTIPRTASNSPERKIIDIPVKKNDTFYTLLSNLNIPSAEIINMVAKARDLYNLKEIQEGTTLNIEMLKGKVMALKYRYGDLDALVLKRNADDKRYFSARIIKIPHSTEPTLISGSIKKTLYDSAIDAGADPQIIVALSEIFAWDVDFATDIRSGDSFRVLYEKVLVDEKPVKTGKILGAEILNDGRKYTAIYYEDKNGHGGYFDSKGRSLNRQLLKSPLRYSRISSYFTNRRYHPILKKYRPHHGIDYAAPVGTPVDSAGSGRVIYAAWKPGYGNFIVIRHNETYSTAYGHLLRIKRGIKRGTRVRQGEVIGYVGSTGLSTGPHLHYEIRVKGRLINPLSVKLSPSRSLRGEDMERFKKIRDNIIAQLSPPDNSMLKVANSNGMEGKLAKQ